MYDSKDLEGLRFFDTNIWIGKDYLSSGRSMDLPKLDGLLSKRRKEYNIHASLVSSLDSLYYYPEIGNKKLSEYIKKTENPGNRVYGCWLLEQELIADRDSFQKKLKKMIKDSFFCLRLVPKSQKYPFEAELMNDIYEVCDEFRYPVMVSIDEIDITGNKNIEWDKIKRISDRFTEMPIILDGGNSKELMFNSYIFCLLEDSKNIYLNTHNLLAVNQIEDISNRFDPSRLLFDTYHPFYIPEISIDRLLLSSLDIEDKKKIAYDNFNKIIENIVS